MDAFYIPYSLHNRKLIAIFVYIVVCYIIKLDIGEESYGKIYRKNS